MAADEEGWCIDLLLAERPSCWRCDEEAMSGGDSIKGTPPLECWN
jgi:hypothetical protein